MYTWIFKCASLHSFIGLFTRTYTALIYAFAVCIPAALQQKRPHFMDVAAKVLCYYSQQAMAPNHTHLDNDSSHPHYGSIQHGKLLCEDFLS